MDARRFALPLAASCALLCCGRYEPPKPSGVASEAFWIGGKENGAFVQVLSQEPVGWRLRISDSHGKVLAEDLYVIRGLARAELKADDFASYQNGILHLKDGGVMTPKK